MKVSMILLAALVAGVGMLSDAQTGRVATGKSAVSGAAVVPMCAANQLSVGTDTENGNFDGMSHSGTLLVLRNLGTAACRVAAVPQISLTDGKKDLGAKGELTGSMPPHSGHGPVMVPVIVAAGAEVTSTLYWVSGEVYDDSVCITPTTVVVTIGGQMQRAPFGLRLCGSRAKGIVYTMTRFVTDPVYQAGK